MLSRPLATLLCAAIGCAAAGCSGDGGDTGSASASASARPPSGPRPSQAEPPPRDGAGLSELLQRLPSAAPARSSETLIGTDTRAAEGDAPAPANSGASIVRMRADLKISNVGIEKDLRATLYYALVDQCRDEDGEILPADAVEIEFRVDATGTLDRSSVRATAAHPEHDAAARCMVRVIRTADARFSAVRLDEPTLVTAKVPSVD